MYIKKTHKSFFFRNKNWVNQILVFCFHPKASEKEMKISFWEKAIKPSSPSYFCCRVMIWADLLVTINRNRDITFLLKYNKNRTQNRFSSYLLDTCLTKTKSLQQFQDNGLLISVNYIPWLTQHVQQSTLRQGVEMNV